MSQQDFNNMRTWNANVVRIALNQDYWLSSAGRFCPTYAANVDTVFHYAVNAGMDVIFDLHWSDAGNLSNPNPGQQLMTDQNSVTFWQQFAAKYANDPHVLFEMYNEPHDISWACWLNGCTTSAGWQAVGMQQIYNAIRGTGANNIVIAGGLNWAFDLSGVPSNRIQGSNIAYATHPYDYPEKQPAAWDSAWGFLTATNPVLVTEFGNFNCTSNYYSTLISYAESHNQSSWTSWAWTANGCSFPSILASSNGLPSDPVGKTIQNALMAMPPN
jgi:endoglucanase